MAATTQAASTVDLYKDLARQLRADSIRCATAAGSGHPTSSLSAADLMAVLLVGHLRYDWTKPRDPANDHDPITAKAQVRPSREVYLIEDHEGGDP